MRVVHLSHSDTAGGAAIASYRMHQGLRSAGVDSRMVVGRKESSDPFVTATASSALWPKAYRKVDQILSRLLATSNTNLISPAIVGYGSVSKALTQIPDLVHLHHICGGFLSIESLACLARSGAPPVIWSLHDTWAFCGGEHYVGDDTRYIEGYQPGNRPPTESGFDLNRWIWNRKKRAWSGLKNLTFVTVSRWLASRVRESALFRGYRVEVLHNAVDPERFKPTAKSAARATLGLPQDKKLVLFGAIDARRDQRKGFDLFQRAIDSLHQTGFGTRVECIVFGADSGPQFAIPTRYLGFFADEAMLSLVYSAADVMVVPSREEAFGQTALEALACGTPVVAFRVGGLPDIVDHEKTGYLANAVDTGDLARGIVWAFEHRDRLAAEARLKVEREFTLELQAKRCLSLYQDILSKRPN